MEKDKKRERISKHDFLSTRDLQKKELDLVFKKAFDLKRRPWQPLLKNKVVAMVFAKPSTRTRVSF